jgi:hypothetical protein
VKKIALGILVALLPAVAHADDSDGQGMIIAGSTVTAVAGVASLVGVGLIIDGVRTPSTGWLDLRGAFITATGIAALGGGLLSIGAAGAPLLAVGLSRRKAARARRAPQVALAPTREGGMLLLGGTF